MDTDALSHSPTVHNKIPQELNLNGLCQYNNAHQAYIFENSNCIVNCSYILIFKAIYMLHHYTNHTPVVRNQCEWNTCESQTIPLWWSTN